MALLRGLRAAFNSITMQRVLIGLKTEHIAYLAHEPKKHG